MTARNRGANVRPGGMTAAMRGAVEAGREAVRLAALRALMRVLAEQDTDTDPAPGPFVSVLLAGHSERGIAAATGLTLDEVRATLVRLAR